MNFSSNKNRIYLVVLLVVILILVSIFSFSSSLNNNKPYYELNEEIPEGVQINYMDVIYTNGGFKPNNLIINTNKILFTNLAEYSIVINANFGDFVEGVKLETGENYYYELEGIGWYSFREQKSGFELKVNVKSLEK